MKVIRKLFELLILLLILCSCSNSKSIDSLKIITPTGAPSLAFINEIDNPNFETNSNTTNIVSAFNSKSNYDVVVFDTISGIKAIKNGAPYKLLCTITFGNFYIATCSNDDNGILDENDRIVLFGKSLTPDIIFHYIYGNKYDDSIEYVNSVSDAGKCLALSKNIETGNTVNYVLIAEPVMQGILNNKSVPTYQKAKPYLNLQDEYKKLSNSNIIQASVFVRNDTNIDLDLYYKNLKDNINKTLNDQDYYHLFIDEKSEEEVQMLFGLDPLLIDNCLKSNSISLGIKKGIENKEEIDNFLKLFNEDETNEEIYIK